MKETSTQHTLCWTGIDKHKVCLAEPADSALIETKTFKLFRFYDNNYSLLEKLLLPSIYIAEGCKFFPAFAVGLWGKK